MPRRSGAAAVAREQRRRVARRKPTGRQTPRKGGKGKAGKR